MSFFGGGTDTEGDSITDVLAGKNAGCKTCYIGEISEIQASSSAINCRSL